MRVRSEVDRTPCTAHLAAYGAQAESIQHRRAGLDGESHRPAVATSLEFDRYDDHHPYAGEGTLLRRTLARTRQVGTRNH